VNGRGERRRNEETVAFGVWWEKEKKKGEGKKV